MKEADLGLGQGYLVDFKSGKRIRGKGTLLRQNETAT